MITNSTVPCYPAREAVSNGILQGDNPTNFALPLLVIQTVIVLATTRTMAFLIKPFRQPRVLAEVIGGVLLGPSGLGRNKAYLNTIFPKQSLTTIDTVSTLGLLFFMFMVGLELDLKEIRRCGKNALLTALSGVAVPFTAGIGIAKLIHQTITPEAKFAPLVVFMGVPISITAFPVLVRIMAERKLLTTELGKIVLPAAAINDLCAWILLAIGVALSGPSNNPATPAYVLLCGVGYVLFMLLVVRKIMEKIAHAASNQCNVKEIYVCVTMVGVLVAGFTTDAIGIHPLFGAFVFGMMVPKEGKFAQMLIEKVEDFVTVLMLPLFFASSGLKTNLGSINSTKAVGILLLLVLTATIGKISSTVIAALLMKLDLQKAFAFGFLMNTKGLVELIVLNIGKDIGVLDDQTFAILILTCLIILFFTTPAVMALYKPARTPIPYVNRTLEGSNSKKDELRILACIYGTSNIPGLINLVEACRAMKKKTLKVFAMHLIELSGRTSAIMSLSKARDGTIKSSSEDSIFVALESYGRLTKVQVKMSNAVSEVVDMHDDICKQAAEKRATIIFLPFNFYERDDGSIEHINQGFSVVNLRVLQHAPCSVGILVDRGSWGSAQLTEPSNKNKVGLIFFGGPDDREALAFSLRLSEHPNVELSVIRFMHVIKEECVITIDDHKTTVDEETMFYRKLDESRMNEIRDDVKEGSLVYKERLYEQHNAIDQVVDMVKSSDYALVVVGRGKHPHMSSIIKHSESNELGIIGDALVNASNGFTASILVIQQHKL